MFTSYFLFFLFLMFFQVLSVNQTCTFIEPCPGHGSCNPLNNYCICQDGYLGNCDTQADMISEYPQIVQLKANDTRLFYLKPIEVQEYIEYTLTICREKDKENVPTVLYVWRQTGSNTEYTPKNTNSPPMILSFDSHCNILTTKYVMLNSQPNGEDQLIVIGLGRNQKPTTLTLTATQRLVLGLTFYTYIMVGLIVFVSLLSLLSAITFMVRRRRRLGFIIQTANLRNTGQPHNIDYFEAYMPSVEMTEETMQKNDCPICLQPIQKKQQIRNTPCSHTFHTICLDSWCQQNLNCPVCRSDFSIDKIGFIKKNVVNLNDGTKGGYQEKWEENVEIEMYMVEQIQNEKPRGVLKEPML